MRESLKQQAAVETVFSENFNKVYTVITGELYSIRIGFFQLVP